MPENYSFGEYHFEQMPHLGPTAGIGIGLDDEPYKFESENEYREWYFDRLNKWLKWA